MAITLGIVEIPLLAIDSKQLSSGRSLSSRRSLAARRLGGITLLEWVVRRITDSELLDRVIILADDFQRPELIRLAPPDVEVFSHTASDPLSQLSAAVKTFQADAIVRLCLGNPFIDPVLIDRLIASANSSPICDYASYCLKGDRPAFHSKIGFFAEWCRGKAILAADQKARLPIERSDATRYILSHPEQFHLRLIPAPPELDRDDVRLSLHNEEDWEHVQVILDALGPEELHWQRIAGLLNHQPGMRQRMADLNRNDPHYPEKGHSAKDGAAKDNVAP